MTLWAASTDLHADGWRQLGELGLALALTTAVGFERELRQKSAGLRTHALVGVGAALFMLISKYGFGDVVVPGKSVVDPSRVAAQIVTGIGFIGAGLIFVRGGGVKGLTTAASVWVTAAIGAAAGAGLPVLAACATAADLLVTVGFPLVETRLPSRSGSAIVVRYREGEGKLRELLNVVTDRGFTVGDVRTDQVDATWIQARMTLHGRGSVHELIVALSDMGEVQTVTARGASAPGG